MKTSNREQFRGRKILRIRGYWVTFKKESVQEGTFRYIVTRNMRWFEFCLIKKQKQQYSFQCVTFSTVMYWDIQFCLYDLERGQLPVLVWVVWLSWSLSLNKCNTFSWKSASLSTSQQDRNQDRNTKNIWEKTQLFCSSVQREEMLGFRLAQKQQPIGILRHWTNRKKEKTF